MQLVPGGGGERRGGREEVTDEKTVQVSWYTCDDHWLTKYCDEHHRAIARVPVSVLEPYVVSR